jgi:hypothetical protein
VLVEDPEVPGDTGLVNGDRLDDVVDGALATPERRDDGAPRRVCKQLEHRHMHHYVYA